MTVSELREALAELPPEAVVLMDCDGGLSLVSSVESLAPEAPELLPQVLLVPSFEE